MQLHGITIDDTFAEAFDMTATRLIVTAANPTWAKHAADAVCGFATSVIGCGVEAGIEQSLAPDQTPDGRPGIAMLLFAVSGSELEKQVVRRVSQCVLTCPSTSLFCGIEGPKSIEMGSKVRFFGDGYQIAKWIGDHRYWRVPVMDGEFVCQERTNRVSAVGGGNFLLMAQSLDGALEAAQAAVESMRRIPNCILPFPGGVARSGSKVGSKYPSLIASTNQAYCPTLRTTVASEVDPDCSAVLEIVIDALTPADMRRAMRVGIEVVCNLGPSLGVKRISAGNYGGKLGKHHFPLHSILSEPV